jgi:signal transduction histidine kinase
MRIEDDLEIAKDEVPEEVKLPLYRVLQEAVNNAVKHSGAHTIGVTLRKNKDNIELMVEDNGCGFDVRGVSSGGNSTSGMGLQGMKERTKLTGGSFSLESRPEEGTRIRASWPLG